MSIAAYDARVAHAARVWNYWLGGKDNFAADRQAGDEVLRAMPVIVQTARANRQFLGTVVHHLAADLGIRQFLDIGTGLPAPENTHEVAQRAAPEARIVYVDNDPIVLTHARALLTSDPRGSCASVEADARSVEEVLAGAAQTLDFSEPVAVLMMAVMHFIPDAADPCSLPGRYMAAFTPGSYLAITHASSDIPWDGQVTAVSSYNARTQVPITLRSLDQYAGFFSGLEIVPPGIVPLGQWTPGAIDTGPEVLPIYSALARKP